MTRTCGSAPKKDRKRAPRTGHHATIEQQEALGVASLRALVAALGRVGAPRSLLFSRVDFKKLQGVELEPLGALDPDVARDTLTIKARREQRERQMQRRGGLDGLLRAIRVA